jgi:hypothetical protein
MKWFCYNLELSACRLFGRIEVWWRDGSWRHLDEWVFTYDKPDCGCHLVEVGFFGITLLHKDCGGRFDGL